MRGARRYVDFEIIKEPWNKYSINDGSKLKTRAILELAWYTEDERGQKKYNMGIKSFTVLMCEPSLQGTPSSVRYTKEQIRKGTEVADSRYSTVSYEANEYVLDDMTRVLMHTNITKISRTKLFNTVGDRIYDVHINTSMTITAPKHQSGAP